MSQDYIDNVYDSTFVVDTTMANVEKNFTALKSAFSGPASPPNPIAGMWWYDTTANILKIRNETNNAWQSVWNFASNKPVIANLSNEITGAMINAAVKDPIAGTAGLRTLGTGAQQACAGNDFKLYNERNPPDASVSAIKLQNASVSTVKLKTSVQEQVFFISSQVLHSFSLTGGLYCFIPQYKAFQSNEVEINIFSGGLGTVYVSFLSIKNLGISGNHFVKHRYVTSSGEINWLFILRDKKTKEIIGRSIAPDHPCFGNGGKPLLVPHPFGDYDETKHEIIVINPTNKEIERMELETIVDDETKPDKDLLEVITENYEIDEDSNPAWPSIPVTVGLPKHVKDKKTGKKKLADYRFMNDDDVVEPIKKIIPQPLNIVAKRLKRRRESNNDNIKKE